MCVVVVTLSVFILMTYLKNIVINGNPVKFDFVMVVILLNNRIQNR